MTIRGMVLGKFLPPHAGHMHLVQVARALCDELVVVVGTLAREPIPGALRAAWMRELCTDCTVVHLDEELPQDPSETPDFWNLWRAALGRVLPFAPDRVFASEAYGHRLAAELGARFVPVDGARSGVPTSGTALRSDPWGAPSMLLPPVRAYYTERISIVGPESCGKSTLTTELARHFGTVAVPEYARSLLEAFDGDEAAADFPLIVAGQIAVEESLARRATRRLFCDTDPLVTVAWAEEFGRPLDGATVARALARPYAHTLLLAPDLPWVADPIRYRPDTRPRFFARCEDLLKAAGRRYTVIGGHGTARLEAALRALA